MSKQPQQQEEEPPVLTELESLQLKCNDITDTSLESTRRMKNMCEEAKDCGIKTLVMLDDQGEQLEKFESGMDNINSDMRLAEQALRSMDLLCGIFPKFWKKSGGFKEDDAVWGDQKQVGGSAPPPPGVEIPNGAFVAKITNDAREDEMEENMEQVSSMIGNLRNMANDMGGELSNQNAQLDRINVKAGSDITRVKMANDKARSLMK
ncbi:SNAP25 [Lepeophtheirus salmonis]|uniref:SNAP25 n=1 Tax=Lepeophtheirus salmonis TaxID=72036 RepID=A0A7R8HAP7_LEPSM|nr:synaptosomal-associated protein 25-like [Lepeophtheirus salmonis]CAB4066234.1 SNAP25 [Lepeophtheirus salmonis]CAF2969980.1 SNAP25 [Lepeophtheirus salmonis]